jgi:hypothetical protein
MSATTTPGPRHHPPPCTTPGCRRPGSIAVTGTHPTGLRCHTHRCPPCAARLAWHYLQHGYTITAAPAARRHANR